MRVNTDKHISKNACVVFGEFVKSQRLAGAISARDAALNAGMLPSNFSKLEHGVLRPPLDASRQRQLGAAVGLQMNSDSGTQFLDLAAAALKSTPVDLAEIISRNEAMPLLLRTIGNKRLGPDQIEKLISLVRGLDEPIENTNP